MNYSYIIKRQIDVANVDADTLDGKNSTDFANKNGDTTQSFYIADGGEDAQAVSLSQLNNVEEKITLKVVDDVIKNIDDTSIKTTINELILFDGADGGTVITSLGLTFTREDVGKYTITFDTEKPDTNYIVNTTDTLVAKVKLDIANKTTASFKIETFDNDNANVDIDVCSLVVIG